jgi:hypothetical protein
MRLARAFGAAHFLAMCTIAGSSAAAAVPPVILPIEAPAQRYAKLDKTACEAELTKRGISFKSETASSVLAPVRLTGPLRGVTFHSSLPAAQRTTSPYEIFDCRLVLALDDFSVILNRYDIVSVIHFSVYRPPPAKFAPPVGKQHTGALAIDAAVFVRKDGTKLTVEKDFHGRIGANTCGAGTSPWPVTPESVALRGIVCEAASARLFNVVLTPDFNWAHRNHFHLEITAGAAWYLVH